MFDLTQLWKKTVLSKLGDQVLEEHIREVTPPRDEFIPIRRQPQAPIFENVPIIEVENRGNNPVSPIQLHRRSPDPFGWQH